MFLTSGKPWQSEPGRNKDTELEFNGSLRFTPPPHCHAPARSCQYEEPCGWPLQGFISRKNGILGMPVENCVSWYPGSRLPAFQVIIKVADRADLHTRMPPPEHSHEPGGIRGRNPQTRDRDHRRTGELRPISRIEFEILGSQVRWNLWEGAIRLHSLTERADRAAGFFRAHEAAAGDAGGGCSRRMTVCSVSEVEVPNETRISSAFMQALRNLSRLPRPAVVQYGLRNEGRDPFDGRDRLGA